MCSWLVVELELNPFSHNFIIFISLNTSIFNSTLFEIVIYDYQIELFDVSTVSIRRILLGLDNRVLNPSLKLWDLRIRDFETQKLISWICGALYLNFMNPTHH